jgi:hypothetical protein
MPTEVIIAIPPAVALALIGLITMYFKRKK